MKKALALALLLAASRANAGALCTSLMATMFPDKSNGTSVPTGANSANYAQVSDLNALKYAFVTYICPAVEALQNAVAALQGGTGGGGSAPTCTAINPTYGGTNTTVGITGTNLPE